MDHLQEKLASSGVEDEDSTVDGLGGQVALKCLVNGDSVDIGVIDEPYDLVGEEISVVLRVEIWLSRF